MTSLSLDSFTTFGDLLRYLRQREQLTQRELSIAVGYSESQINRLEHNLRLPEPSIIAAQFIPALHLEDDPEIASRLIELAAEARGEPAPASFIFIRSTQREVADTAASLQQRRTNLPMQLTRFIGRQDELAELAARVKTTRLLTLMGAGGVGKTRLALEVASQFVGAGFPRPSPHLFPDGIWLVEFASIADAELVSQAAAAVLGVTEQPGASVEDLLLTRLRSWQALLIFDNCEHLVSACAALAERLLRACPELHILVTSREPLHIAGEVTWRVPSLRTPDPNHLPPLEELLDAEAVQLFVERARANQPQFEVTARSAAAVAQVCHRLDGIPLAIELAAGRVNILSVEQIAQRLDGRFSLLTSGARTALPRHQTLRGDRVEC
jgi:transcriptional regulator with XRE-family HTH domain